MKSRDPMGMPVIKEKTWMRKTRQSRRGEETLSQCTMRIKRRNRRVRKKICESIGNLKASCTNALHDYAPPFFLFLLSRR